EDAPPAPRVRQVCPVLGDSFTDADFSSSLKRFLRVLPESFIR
ncbi:unnamed protein product, partial [Oikopleura dioica]